jgi:hypothetical protein
VRHASGSHVWSIANSCTSLTTLGCWLRITESAHWATGSAGRQHRYTCKQHLQNMRLQHDGRSVWLCFNSYVLHGITVRHKHVTQVVFRRPRALAMQKPTFGQRAEAFAHLLCNAALLTCPSTPPPQQNAMSWQTCTTAASTGTCKASCSTGFTGGFDATCSSAGAWIVTGGCQAAPTPPPQPPGTTSA